MAEMDLETLQALNKEQAKEIKTQQKKLQRVEERYVLKHKENETLNAEKQQLLNVLSKLFPDKDVNADLEKLLDIQAEKEQAYKKNVQQLTQKNNDLQANMQQNSLNYLLQMQKKDLELEDLKQQLLDYQKTQQMLGEVNANLAISEKTCEQLRLENLRLSQVEEECARLKAENLMEKLSEEKKIMQPDQHLVHVLQLSREMNDQKDIITDLEKQIKELKQQQENSQNQISSLESDLQVRDKDLQKSKQDLKEFRKKAQKMLLEKESEYEKHKQTIEIKEEIKEDNDQETNIVLRKRIAELERSLSREGINLEYLKNIVVKYMECIGASNHKEAHTLQNVIQTVLCFSQEEVSLVEAAKNTGYFWGESKVGSGVSYNILQSGLIKNADKSSEAQAKERLQLQKEIEQEEAKWTKTKSPGNNQSEGGKKNLIQIQTQFQLVKSNLKIQIRFLTLT